MPRSPKATNSLFASAETARRACTLFAIEREPRRSRVDGPWCGRLSAMFGGISKINSSRLRPELVAKVPPFHLEERRDTIRATSGDHFPADIPPNIADKRPHQGPSTRELRGSRSIAKRVHARRAISALANREFVALGERGTPHVFFSAPR